MRIKQKGYTLVFICALTGLIFQPASAEVHNSLFNAKTTVQNTSADSFRGEGLKRALLEDLEGIDITITVAELETDSARKNQTLQDALNNINKLSAQTNGCINNVPSEQNWLINCSDSAAVNATLTQLAAEVSALIQ